MQNQPETPFARDFKLSITRALGEQLLTALEQTTTAPLTPEYLDKLQPRPGVYELHHLENGALRRVYVGKATNSLPQRLNKHLRKLSGRDGIFLGDMAFKCAYVDEDFDSSAPEKMLIKQHVRTGGVIWNNNGFGNNDPGVRRDKSVVKENHFDAQYPANMQFSVVPSSLNMAATISVGDALTAVKSALPFLVRFPNPEKADEKLVREDLATSVMDLSVHLDTAIAADKWLELAIEALPHRWQATVLPGYAIVYPKHGTYPSARWYWRRALTGADRIAGSNVLGPSGDIGDALDE